MRMVPAARPVCSATSLIGRPFTTEGIRAPRRRGLSAPPRTAAGGIMPRTAMKLLNRPQQRRIADAVIADPEEHTVMDASGAVRSIQAADVEIPAAELDAIWDPLHLERLARTYWKFLSRVTLGLIRVEYTRTERRVVLLSPPFVLLRFGAPEYELGADRGIVRWRIQNGILVARPGHGYLEIDVRRLRSDRPGCGRV